MQNEPGTRSNQRARRTNTRLGAMNSKRELEWADVSCWWEPCAHTGIEAHGQENTEQQRGLARAAGSPPSSNRRITGSCCAVGASGVKNQVKNKKKNSAPRENNECDSSRIGSKEKQASARFTRESTSKRNK
jgi:hypothetical protein